MASPALIFLILMMSSFSRAVYGVILDVRLMNGSKPNEGTILYTEDCLTWHTSCGRFHKKRNETDVICRHLGYPATNRALEISPYGDYGSPSTQIKCKGDENNVSKCNVTECSSGTPGGVTCYENNYIGCFIDNTSTRVLLGRQNTSFIGLTIDKCLEFCRQHSSIVFAGVENSHECYCSNNSMTNLNIHGRAQDNECNYKCNGSEYEACGGLNRIAIFNLTAPLHLSPYPMDSPCDTTTPPRISTMSSEVTAIVQATSQETPASTQGLRTSDMSEDGSNTPSGSSAFTETVSGPDRTSSSTSRTPNAGLRTSDMSEDGSNTLSGSSAFTETVSGPDRTSSSTSRTPNTGLRTSDMSEDGSNIPSGSSAFTETVSGPDRTSSSTSRTPNAAPYGSIGGGVAVAVGAIVVIIIIIVLRRKSKEKEDQKYGVCEMTKNTSGSPGYENSIVGFHEATDRDTTMTTEDLYEVVEKDAFSAQMKRGTMIVDYVNVKWKADTTGNDAMTSKDVGGSDELYAMSTKHRLEPDGREVAKEEADMYAVPDKGRKNQLSHDALGKSHPVEEVDDAGDLYAMPDKNRRNKNALTSSRSDNIEMMYAMPDKPRFGQLHDDDDDTTEMVDNELYG